MSADLPFDRDVDRAALERHREEQRAMERRARIRTEMHRAAGAGPSGRREAGGPPLTESITAHFNASELRRLHATAKALRVSPRTLVRAATLILVLRAEGRL